MSHTHACTVGGLLDLVGQPIMVPATEPLVVAEGFAVGTEEPPIVQVDPAFERHFFGSVEDGMGPGTLTQREMRHRARHQDVVEALGSEPQIALAHLRYFLITADPTCRYISYAMSKRHYLQPIVAFWQRGWVLDTERLHSTSKFSSLIVSYV